MGKDLAAKCFNWGNPVCHPDVGKYLDLDSKSGEAFPKLPAIEIVEKFDKICRKCRYLDLGVKGIHPNTHDRYNPVYVISNVWGKFHAIPDYRKSQLEDYAVFLEIKQNRKKGYLIKFTIEAFLWTGSMSQNTWKVIEEPEELYCKRDSIGKVHIRFKGEEVKIHNRVLAPFPSYGVFWDYIKQ